MRRSRLNKDLWEVRELVLWMFRGSIFWKDEIVSVKVLKLGRIFGMFRE